MAMMAMTIRRIQQKKLDGERIAVLTAYDFPTARIFDEAGVDLLLVGDSLANVVQGRPTTLSVTLDQMIYHAEIVARAASRAVVIVDLPFPHGHLSPFETVAAAARILRESGAQGVKLEGGESVVETITALVRAGIPVLAHCGMLPQSIHQMGGFRVQRDRERLLADVRAVEAAGAFAVVLECIPVELAVEATQMLKIPTIGIGAGSGCNGQVLVAHDMLGFTADERPVPKHAKRYTSLRDEIMHAAKTYVQEVRDGIFPAAE